MENYREVALLFIYSLFIMSDSIQVGNNGICGSCSLTPSQGQCVKCFSCKGLFHAICENTDNEARLGSKTMITTFLAVSTKNNFKFFCDKCLTNLEIGIAEGDDQKFNSLERKVNNIENKLNDIPSLLRSTQTSKTNTHQASPVKLNIWNDEDKLAKIKAPPAKSILIVKNVQECERNKADQATVETTIMENNTPVFQYYKNKSGDTVIICEDNESRDEIQNLVSLSNDAIEMSSPVEKMPSVSIVGLPREYSKDEVIQMLVLQNACSAKWIHETVRNNKSYKNIFYQTTQK